MKYVFFSIGLMCLLILLLGNLVLIINRKKEKLFYTNFLCKYSMTAIKGMAILIIIMGHLGNIFGVRVFNPLGSCGVAIFLFCSGYGLQKSYYKKNLKNYWKKRFFAAYIPYICIEIILYIFLYISAPLVAQFYGIPLLSSILKVQGIVLITNSLSIIQLNRLKKQLEFKKIATISIVSAVLSVVIAIILAYRGWGVWSLVIQQLFVSFFNTVLLWVYGQWVPLFIFSKKSFKELFNFGSFKYSGIQLYFFNRIAYNESSSEIGMVGG